MATQIQHRRGTASEWTAANPVLAEGELGLVTDTGRFKIGDGATAWDSLAYPSNNPTFGVSTYDQIAEPSAPEAGKLHVYANDAGGRMLPRFKGPSGLDSALQPAIFGNGIYAVFPGTTTAPTTIGGPALTAVGTVSHPVIATTSLRQQMSRFNVLSAATADSVASVRPAFARAWRGDAPGLGGFFFRARFSINSTVTNQRTFFGLHPNSLIAVTATPSALLNMIGVGNDLGEANLQILTNSNTGSAAKVDLGSSFPSQGVDDVYDLTLFAPPNASVVNWKIQRYGNGAAQAGTLSDVSKLPQTSAFLAPYLYMNNGGATAAVNFDCSRIYLETDL